MGASSRPKLTIPELSEKKRAGDPIVMITAYDYAGALVAEQAGVDIVLVGDSAGMVQLGYKSTVPVTVEELIILGKAVRRGLTSPLLVADLPFGSYEGSDEQAIATAQRFMKEVGSDAVKIERGGLSAQRANAIVRAGMPVMGHVGLTPQSVSAIGGYRVRGKTSDQALRVFHEALELQRAGCFSLVFEAMPASVVDILMEHIEVPVIGIGAGSSTDGQVLVFHDLLGLGVSKVPRFVKRYAELHESMVDAVRTYSDEVRSRRFPTSEHSYSAEPEEVARIRQMVSSLFDGEDRFPETNP